MKMMRSAVVGMLLMLVLAACGGGGADTASESTGDTGEVTADRAAVSQEKAAAPQPASGEGFEEQSGDLALSQDSTGATSGGGASGGGGDDAVEDDVDAPRLEPLPNSSLEGQRIIKEGSVSIEVPEGKFDSAFSSVIANARKLGGDVVGSSTRTNDDGDTFGSVTVRVPVEDFEDLLVTMGGIGTITGRDITSQDVSAEYTDLESRLRHLEALERFYLGLFDDAKNVDDAITVQQRLADVQGQIEKAQGRLNLLDDRTSFSTLTVEITEPGAAAPPPEEEPGSERPSLAQYWETARDAFVNVVGAMLVALLFILPLLVPLALLGAAGLALRRSRRTAAAPVEPREAEPERVSVDA